MRVGDILLIQRRFCLVSWLICKYTGGNYSHIAWAVNPYNVIEVGACGTRTTPSKVYKKSFWYKTKLLRIKSIDQFQLCQAVYESTLKKYKYSYWNFLCTCIRIVCKKPVTRFTCASFVTTYLLGVGWILCGKVTRIFPSDFETSFRLEEVKDEDLD